MKIPQPDVFNQNVHLSRIWLPSVVLFFSFFLLLLTSFTSIIHQHFFQSFSHSPKWNIWKILIFIFVALGFVLWYLCRISLKLIMTNMQCVPMLQMIIMAIIKNSLIAHDVALLLLHSYMINIFIILYLLLLLLFSFNIIRHHHLLTHITLVEFSTFLLL